MDTDRLRIVIVEDEPAHAEAICRALKASCSTAEVQVAGSLREYRDAVAAVLPDIVIMDMKLPDGIAFDVLSASPESGTFPVVVMTSYGNEQLAVEAMKAGALDYVVKSPTAFADMPGTIERCLREWNLLQERNQAEENRIRLLTAVEQVHDTVMILDPDGTIQYVNRALEEITGQSRQELLGKNILDRDNTTDMYRSVWQRVVKGELWSGTITERKKDGTACEFELTLTPVLNEQGVIYSVVSMGRDVTKEKLLEARLVQSQKMEAIGTLAGGIAHDFNNILSAVIGYTELSQGMVAEGEPLANNLQQVLLAGQRARDLVKQILTFSRQSAQDKKPVQVSQIVQEVFKLLRASLPSNLEIKLDLCSNSLVLADPTQIHQIMMNLCTNAAHAMRENGGILSVMVSDVTLDSEFVEIHKELEPGRYLKFSVTDTGCGMSKELLDRIFDPFFTTKGKEEGTGLGLSVVHGIVKECSGTITVYSEPGTGSTFIVYLPLIMEATEAAALQDGPLPPGTEQILLVDDEENIVRLGCQILDKQGYVVESRCNALEALELFKSQPDRFDLVITDMTMPKMMGDKLADEIHRIRPDVPVILMSGKGLLLPQEEIKALGIEAVLMKPVSMRTMTETIRHVLTKP